ncbi:MAG: hypothetical protein HY696_07400 [Deltaproteobacteria bacterium]|nr:hypothetical protein [Deltaproteobacteria bacterium]
MDPMWNQQQCVALILERAVQLSQGDLQGGHPAVLSCGGIFVPRPRPMSISDPLYHILYTPNDQQPAKVVSALITKNLLDEILNKDRVN